MPFGVRSLRSLCIASSKCTLRLSLVPSRYSLWSLHITLMGYRTPAPDLTGTLKSKMDFCAFPPLACTGIPVCVPQRAGHGDLISSFMSTTLIRWIFITREKDFHFLGIQKVSFYLQRSVRKQTCSKFCSLGGQCPLTCSSLCKVLGASLSSIWGVKINFLPLMDTLCTYCLWGKSIGSTSAHRRIFKQTHKNSLAHLQMPTLESALWASKTLSSPSTQTDCSILSTLTAVTVSTSTSTSAPLLKFPNTDCQAKRKA